MSDKTCYLVRVGTSGSDGGHKVVSSFHTVPNISRTFDISAVVIMVIDKIINEAHYHESVLEAS